MTQGGNYPLKEGMPPGLIKWVGILKYMEVWGQEPEQEEALFFILIVEDHLEHQQEQLLKELL